MIDSYPRCHSGSGDLRDACYSTADRVSGVCCSCGGIELRTRRRRTLITVCTIFFLLGGWIVSWLLRWDIGLTHPFTNLRYFHYGSEPESFGDKVLYVVYYPLYSLSDGRRFREGLGRTSVHWSDRDDGLAW